MVETEQFEERYLTHFLYLNILQQSHRIIIEAKIKIIKSINNTQAEIKLSAILAYRLQP